ncbi:MAG: M20/M25/M40 family metallo-hydrolase [Acinetobacter sp.]
MQLLATPSPSGYERQIGVVIQEYAKRYCDEVSDYHGNIVAVQRGIGAKRIMIAAHMDVIGMLVMGISEDGMLYFVPIGSTDIGILPGLRVTIWHNNKPVCGVIGRKAVHLLDDSEKMNINPKELWIDIGCSSLRDSSLRVAIGDIVTFNAPATCLNDNTICSPGLDNKAGVLAVCRIMQTMAKRTAVSDSFMYVFTTQEEIGCRGVQIVAQNLDIDQAYVIDAIHATDYPCINHLLYGFINIGHGPVISIAPEVSPDLCSRLIAVAQDHQIAFQVDVKPRSTNTEASFVQLSKSTPQTAVVSIPIRYMHSPNEICCTDDIENVSRLLEHILVANSSSAE